MSYEGYQEARVTEQQGRPQQQQTPQRRYHQCNKGCGQEIYFDTNHSKSQAANGFH
jgi:hypothetical protein